MTMNPYTARLLALVGQQEPLVILEETPRRLADLLNRIGEEGLERSHGPGKWPARTIFAHLADVEIAVGFRVRQVLSQDNHVIQPFDQDAWARRYGTTDPALAVRAQAALRRWNLALFRTLDSKELARAASHPERGGETIERIIRMLAGHDLNHLAQLEKVADAAHR